MQAFEANLWVNISPDTRCGNCHKANGQSPMFARSDDINQAYSAALTVVNLSQPETSTMVQKVAGGHNCWLSSPQACADILTTWISNWAGGGSGAAVGTQIPLTAPPAQTVGRPRCFRAIRPSSVRPSIRWCSSIAHAAIPTPPPRRSRRTLPAVTWPAPTLRAARNQPQCTEVPLFYIRLAQHSHNCWGNPVNCPAERRHRCWPRSRHWRMVSASRRSIRR